MGLSTHIGYDVYNLEKTITFYQEILGAKLEFKNEKRRSASLTVGGCEVNLFEIPAFGGYHSSIIKSMHIGFQCSDRSTIDAIYQRAAKSRSTVFDEPTDRWDGDYTFFIQDPNGMQLEIYFGTHHLERKEVSL